MIRDDEAGKARASIVTFDFFALKGLKKFFVCKANQIKVLAIFAKAELF